MKYHHITKEKLPKLPSEQNSLKDNDINEENMSKDFSLGKRMALVLISSIIVGEILIMFIIQILHIKSAWVEAPIDSLLLSILILPAIYFFVILPLSIQTRKRKQAEEVLKESEKRYRTLFELSNDAIFIVDKSTGNYLDANNAAEILTGRTLAELKKLKTYDLTPKDADKRLERVTGINETLELGEVEYLRTDGIIRTVLLNSIPLSKDHIFGIANDITERKQAEEALKKSEKLYRSLFENMLNGFAYCQMHFDDNDKPFDFTYLSVNSAFETLTGLTEVVGRKASDVIPGIRESDPELLELYGKVSKTGKPERFEIFVDSLQMWFSISVYSPKQGYFVSVFDVINDRKQSEEAIKNALSLTEAILESIHNGILVVSEQGDVIKTNAKFAELWHIPEEILTSGNDKILIDFILEQLFDPDRFIASVSELYSKPEAESFDLINFRDGRIFERISKPFYLRGESKGRVWSFLDVTERRLAEETIYNERSLLRTLIDNIPDSIYSKDLASRKTLANLAEVRILKAKSDAEVLGKDDFDFYPKELAEKFFIDDQSVIQSGESVLNREEYIPGDKGQRRWLLTSKLPLRDMNNQIIGLVGIGRDITVRKMAEEALRKSEAHLQTLLQTVPDLIWLKDPSSVYLSCNSMFERLVGLKEAEIVGKTDYDIFSREDAEFFRENDHNAISAGKPLSNEEWLNFADNGHHALFDVIKTPMYDSLGTLIGVLGIGHDITKRKKMEEALMDSEDKFSKAFHISPYAITISSAKDGKFVEMNDAFISLSGFTREEALGHTSVDLDLWANVEDRNWVLSALNEGREVEGKEFQFKKKNGETGTGLYSAQLINLHNEPFFLSSINDITYRKQAEKVLRESEEKYRYMFDNNPQPMWIYDLETLAFLEVNQAAINHYGYSKEEFLSMTVKDIRPAEDLTALLKDIQNISAIRSSGGEWRHLKKNEELLFVEISAHSVIYNGRDARHVLVNDITERKRTEAEIKLKNEQLTLAHAEKDKFFSIIAHDLRSPFNGFLGLTQIMAEDLPNMKMSEIQEIAVSMKNSATNLYRLLENLLQWAQMQRELIPFAPEVIHLRPVLEECIASALETAKNKGIHITNTVQDNTEVFADNNMLQAVIRNLVSNAMKFTPKGGEISISAKTTSDKSVEISITDTGIGMSSAIVDNLFRPDVQTSRKGTEDEPSSGLGLLLCKEFIEKHGGKIWAESEEGKGSVFRFTLQLSH